MFSRTISACLYGCAHVHAHAWRAPVPFVFLQGRHAQVFVYIFLLFCSVSALHARLRRLHAARDTPFCNASLQWLHTAHDAHTARPPFLLLTNIGTSIISSSLFPPSALIVAVSASISPSRTGLVVSPCPSSVPETQTHPEAPSHSLHCSIVTRSPVRRLHCCAKVPGD